MANNYKLTIAGTDVASYIHREYEVRHSRVASGRSTLEFSLLETCPTFPTRFDAVIAYASDLTTPVFVGVLLTDAIRSRQQHEALFHWPMVCVDLSFYMDYCYVTYSAVDVTLLTVMTALVAAYGGARGISVYSGQAAGPTVTLDYTVPTRWSDVVRDLAASTGYTSRIRTDGSWEFYVAGTAAAPVGFTNAATQSLQLDWQRSSAVPASCVIGTFGPTGTFETEFTAVGDGVTVAWVTDIPAGDTTNGSRGYVTYDGANQTVSEPGGGGTWEWDSATHTLTATFTPAAAKTISFFFNGAFPFIITLGSGVIQSLLTRTDIVNYQQGYDLTQGALDTLNQSPREFTSVTMREDFDIGQAVPVTVTNLRTSGASLLITQMDGVLNADGFWVTTLTLLESIGGARRAQAGTIDKWRKLLGRTGGSAGSTSGGGGSVTTLSSPVAMGGDETRPRSMVTSAVKPIVNYYEFTPDADFTGYLRCWLRAFDAGTGVAARVSYSNDNWVADVHIVGTTAKITSTTFAFADAICAMKGGQPHRVETSVDIDGDGYCRTASLEAA